MNKLQSKKDKNFDSALADKIADGKKVIQLPSVITVKELSEIASIPVVSLISELMKSGILAAINESIDFETAAIVCDDLGVKCELQDNSHEEISEKQELEKSKKLIERPPIVTIMGHVDHGKTSLLDKIRLASVALSESGGITQHISAYQVVLKKTIKKDLKNNTITFIDTPGHAAFSALRSHGAAITDIVVLIIAADDGVMPQTVEVIEQCQLHHVPIIVAINKIDLPNADVMKVKQQLSEYQLVPEEWGGKTIMTEISAKTNLGIENLLELILVQAEMMELKADPREKAFGVVIESHIHKGAGPLAVILITNGTLHKGDIVQIGNTCGRVRIMEDFNHQPIESAGPSMPVRVAGINGLPSFGEHLMVFDTEKEAKCASANVLQHTNLKVATAKRLDQDDQQNQDQNLDYLIIIKSDVNGSLEAIKKLISEIDTKELKIKIIGEGIGAVSESDVTLAKAVKAIIISFRVPVLVSAKYISEKDNVMIKSYDVIYELIDDIKRDLSAKLPPEIKEETLGSGKVLAIFRNDKKMYVAGAKLESGKVNVGDKVRISNKDQIIHDGNVLSLRREKENVTEVSAGVEFGLGLEPGTKASGGDTVTIYKVIEIERKIS